MVHPPALNDGRSTRLARWLPEVNLPAVALGRRWLQGAYLIHEQNLALHGTFTTSCSESRVCTEPDELASASSKQFCSPSPALSGVATHNVTNKTSCSPSSARKSRVGAPARTPPANQNVGADVEMSKHAPLEPTHAIHLDNTA